MTSPKSYDGSCFCGAVQFTVTGEPVSMGYCHCNSCRHWSAAPVNAFTLWQSENVRITQGEENIGTFSKTTQSNRKWCKTCGGHVFTEHPGLGLIDVTLRSFLVSRSFRAARELQRNQIAHWGWFAQAQGFSPRIWWVRN
jgi:hypothetical protein